MMMKKGKILSSLALLVLLAICACKPSGKVGELVGVNENPPLEGTRWKFTTADAKPGTFNLWFKLDATTKTVTGDDGCHQLKGTYTLDGKKIKLSIEDSKMSIVVCTGDRTQVDALLNALTTVDKYSLKERSLELLKGNDLIGSFSVYTRQTY